MILNKIMLIKFSLFKNICFIFLICAACTSAIKSIQDNESQNQSLNCPEGWRCSFEILENKSVKIEFDKFNYSYLTTEDSKSMVLVFKYQIGGLQTNRYGIPNQLYGLLDQLSFNLMPLHVPPTLRLALHQHLTG